jgi:hypothetical protein
MYQQLLCRVSIERERGVFPLHTPEQLHGAEAVREDVEVFLTRTALERQCNPVNSGRIDDGWSKTATLRAGMRPSLAISAPHDSALLERAVRHHNRCACTQHRQGQAAPLARMGKLGPVCVADWGSKARARHQLESR